MVKAKKKRVKRTAALLLAVAGVIFSFAACGSPQGQGAQALYDSVTAKVNANADFAEVLAPLDKETGCTLYGVDPAQVSTATVYVGSGAYVDEFAAFMAADSAQATSIKAKAEQRIASQQKLYSSYNTGELPKLDSPVVFVKDNLVVVCIGGNDALTSYLKSTLK